MWGKFSKIETVCTVGLLVERFSLTRNFRVRLMEWYEMIRRYFVFIFSSISSMASSKVLFIVI